MEKQKETPIYNDGYEKLTTETRAHADVFNHVFSILIDNDNYLKADKMERPFQQEIAISKDGWTAATYGQFAVQRVVPVEGITAQDIPSCQVSVETESIAQDCNLAFQCQSGDGSITFYAGSVPTGNIICNVTIMKGA